MLIYSLLSWAVRWSEVHWADQDSLLGLTHSYVWVSQQPEYSLINYSLRSCLRTGGKIHLWGNAATQGLETPVINRQRRDTPNHFLMVPDTSKCPFQYFFLQNVSHTAKDIIMKAMTMKAIKDSWKKNHNNIRKQCSERNNIKNEFTASAEI